MARPREVPDLSCEEPFSLAAARVISVRADELLEHSEGVLDIDDIERLHDMRVASRRLRAAMEVFAPCFPRKRFRAALKQVKAIADALGERRDRDVSIAALGEFSDKLAAVDPLGVAVLVERLGEEQETANNELVPYVDSRQLQKLRDEIGELVEAAREVVG